LLDSKNKSKINSKIEEATLYLQGIFMLKKPAVYPKNVQSKTKFKNNCTDSFFLPS